MKELSLVLGNKLFKEGYYKENEKTFIELSEKGQQPKALYIGCSDSRVLPNLMTKSAPGDLFVIRNVGNFVAPYNPDNNFHSTASAIEYAVSILKTENIIVCGHTHCGAINALYDEKGTLDSKELVHTRKWLSLGDNAKKQALLALGNRADKDMTLRLTEKLSVISQIENLLTYPSVKKRVESGTLTIHGWMYDIESGEIEYYDPDTSQFEPLSSLVS
jgi:carbonic anhydrase